MKSRLVPLLLPFAALLVAAAAAAPKTGERRVDFNRDVRPILSDNCFACHGQDAAHRAASLRLDTAEGARAKLPSGNRAVVPGKPEESGLLARVQVKGPLQMPPAATGKTLTRAQIETLREWIRQGARYAQHWAFAPVTRPAVPEIQETPDGWMRAWARTPIDRFVARRLVEEGLRPSPPADRRTLLRRLSLDLIGLPPTPEEVEAFLADRAPGAYERQVERLLASPRYGERMAQYWLDVVRYADTDGYHGDRHRTVFPFRDWVIRAFNENMPFDQFTIAQVAGDLLPNPTLEQRVASGYHRLNMVTREGGAQPKEYLIKYSAERVRTTTGAWLGITMGCAECHDHKYDPFTQRDFYRFAAFFADIQQVGLYPNDREPLDPIIRVPSPEQNERLATLASQVDAARAALEAAAPTGLAAWEAEQRALLAKWSDIRPDALSAANGTTLSLLPDGSVLASGDHPRTETYTLRLDAAQGAVTALRVEVLPHDSLPQKGPGRAGNGNFVLSQIRLFAGEDRQSARPVAFRAASATFEQAFAAEAIPGKRFSAALAIDGAARDPHWGWAVLDQVGRPQHAVFELAEPVKGPLLVVLEQTHPYHGIGRFRLAVTCEAAPPKADAGLLAPELREALATAPEARTREASELLARRYRETAAELAPLREALAKAQKERDDFEASLPTMLVTVSTTPMPTRVLARGNWMDETGPLVEPGTPETLPGGRNKTATRMDLARWLVDGANPLTPRVLANRLWALFFGHGLSRTPADFGMQGEHPTHPELLDWLASELVRPGNGARAWDIKRFVRMLVTSNTYRQSSSARKELRERDPYNHLLARQSRFRLPAEQVRDNALAVAGLLSPKIGGRSVFPYQPAGYWDHCNTFAGPLIYQQDHGEDLYRRGLYTYWKRTFLHPAMVAFDAPTREECVVERPRSNTPLQALVTLNDPTFVEAARVLAARALTECSGDDAARIAWCFQRAVARPATAEETRVLAQLLVEQRNEYKSDAAAARALLSVGEMPAPPTLDPAELAAWTAVCRAILNLSETLTRA